VERVTALFAADADGRLELLGVTQAGDVAARVAQALLAERPMPSKDREFREVQEARRRALARAAMGGAG
jgi:hypothetical protein